MNYFIMSKRSRKIDSMVCYISQYTPWVQARSQQYIPGGGKAPTNVKTNV